MKSVVRYILLFGYLATIDLYGQSVSDDLRAQFFTKQAQKYAGGSDLQEISFWSPVDEKNLVFVERHGNILKREGAKAIVLVCHGYMCNKEDIGFLRLLFPEYHVMMFDFRAHGKGVKESDCCSFGLHEASDVRAAVHYLKSDQDLKDLPIFAYGFSMGAVASILAQSQEPLFAGMILDCPFDHSKTVISFALRQKISLFGYSFSIPGATFLERYAFHPYVQNFIKAVVKTLTKVDATAINTRIYPINPAYASKKISIPCYFIHCRNDEKVPIDAVKAVYNGTTGFKRLWLTNGRRHFDSFFANPEAYFYRVNKFMTDVLSGSIMNKQQKKIKNDEII